jgi:protein-S-isoprenylcysteine O-methyltransferase Ste14
MSTDTAHTSYWQISEVVFGVPLLAAIGLQWAFPLSLPPGPLRLATLIVGAALLVAGGALAISARREFAHHRQSMEPKRSISTIVNTGVFSISRNPLYLGLVVALAGAALVFNNLWILITLLPAIVVCHYVLIVPEERYLVAKFGDEYRAHTGSVRRWLGRT